MNVPVTDIPIDEEAQKEAELQRMKHLATSMFWIAAVIFIVSSIFEQQYVWIGFVRATAEAAMVGAIADWFAVTALFRHPLGLKIPHTAIIPRRKNHIGETFGRFVQENFLSEDVISDRLKSMPITKQVGHWISQPENSWILAGYISTGLRAIVEVLRDEEVQETIEKNLQNQLRAAKIAPFLGNILTLVTAGERQKDLLKGLIQLVAQLLKENRKAIQKKISEETPWWFPQNVDEAIYKKIVISINHTVQEVNRNPDHPLYDHFNKLLTQFIEDLKHSPEVMAKEDALKEEFLAHEAVQEFSASVWQDIKSALLSSEVKTQEPIQKAISQFGQTILRDENLREKLDGWVRTATLYVIKEYGDEVSQLISQTIRRWDTEATSRKIELYVGRDLQFIRINGTLVGGIVGLVIHTISYLFFH